jgi:hypothetical protein
MLVFLAAIAFSCQNDRLPSEPEQNVEKSKFKKVDDIKAELFLYVLRNDPNDPPISVNIHLLTEDWDERRVSWDFTNKTLSTPWSTQGGTFTDVSVPAPSFSPNVKNQYLPGIDITDIVKAWLKGTADNHGIILEQGQTSPYIVYRSKTTTFPPYVDDNVPYILITSPNGAQYKFIPTADAYIWENNPTFTGTGDDGRLYTGLLNGNEKRTLLKFEVTYEGDSGCTLTPGYWKTHSKYGPAPYDATWNDMEDDSFFQSGQTYYDVLWTPPKGGNAYYILAHAYIATHLNQLNGADFTDALDAFNSATYLFNNYTPDYVGGLKGKNGKKERQEWIELAEILDDYNNGIIGPGHCE